MEVIEGLGSTIDVILIQRSLKEGDTIVMARLNEPM